MIEKLGDGVMVARGTLDPSVKVRILLPQPEVAPSSNPVRTTVSQAVSRGSNPLGATNFFNSL